MKIKQKGGELFSNFFINFDDKFLKVSGYNQDSRSKLGFLRYAINKKFSNYFVILELSNNYFTYVE